MTLYDVLSVHYKFGAIDINECQSSNGGCEQSCMNTLGSFVCSCDSVSGYTLGSDGLSCRGSYDVV